MTAKILVTGATGNTGSEIVKQLAAQAVSVRALVRNPAKAEAINLPDVEIVSGDFDDINSLTSALQGIEKAFLNIPDGLTGMYLAQTRLKGWLLLETDSLESAQAAISSLPMHKFWQVEYT
jgi:NAD(P)-dependent dehydrogenase (short-subunit alcohol dehydrogenase family)